jgi:predicted nuclease of predicted toxin-antitoxin system
MRLLLDNNLSPRLSVLLREAGHDTQHIRDQGLKAASDEVVLEYARSHRRVLISADTDFGTLLARSGAKTPSIVLNRRSRGRRPGQIAALLLANLDQIADDWPPARSSLPPTPICGSAGSRSLSCVDDLDIGRPAQAMQVWLWSLTRTFARFRITSDQREPAAPTAR